MNWQKSIVLTSIRALICCPAVVIYFGLSSLGLHSYPELQARVKFPPTVKRSGVPPRTAGAGTRWIKPAEDITPGSTTTPDALRTSPAIPAEPADHDQPSRGGGSPEPFCTPASKIPLTALTPSNNVGTTVAAPTFFWYVPKTTAKTAEFVIVDDNRKDVYRTTFALSGTPGIVQLQLPQTVDLKIGKSYLWQFEIVCDPQNRQIKNKTYVQGLVRRVEISPILNRKLNYAVSPLAKAELYADAGIWHESLTNLAQVRSSRPTEWEKMLKSVGLDAIASAPFVKCCTITEY